MASTTKLVTATMIIQLVQAGRLSLEDPLSRFYPKLPNARRILVRQLLNHTSGLGDYFDNKRIQEAIDDEPRHRWTRNEVLEGVGRPQFSPGARHEYVNTNYVVLGGIVEQVAKTSIERYFRLNIAAPASLPTSSFAYRPRRSSWFARSYEQQPDGSRTSAWARGVGIPSDTWGEVWTDGGLASTAPELARFVDVLFHGGLVSAPLLDQMASTHRYGYGFGIRSKRHRGHRWLGHDGVYGGYESEVWHDRGRQVTIAVLTNLEEREKAKLTTSERIWRAVASAYGRSLRGGCS